MPQAPSGLDAVPNIPWGTHITHFFTKGDDLRETLVPYFKAGLENNERCLWVTGGDFDAEQARASLRQAVPDLDARESSKQIEIKDGHHFYARGRKLEPYVLVEGLVKAEQDALGSGYRGLRTSGNCAWVDRSQWRDFEIYEGLVQDTVRGRRMICMCSYHTTQSKGSDLIAVMDRHDFAIPPRRRAGLKAV